MPNKKPLRTDMAIASHLGWDVAEIREHRYQQHHTPCPVYTVGGEYLTATSGKTPKNNEDYQWQRVDSWVTEVYGNVIWKTIRR